MHSTYIRSGLTFLSITIAALLVWLLSLVTADSPAIVSAAPVGRQHHLRLRRESLHHHRYQR